MLRTELGSQKALVKVASLRLLLVPVTVVTVQSSFSGPSRPARAVFVSPLVCSKSYGFHWGLPCPPSVPNPDHLLFSVPLLHTQALVPQIHDRGTQGHLSSLLLTSSRRPLSAQGGSHPHGYVDIAKGLLGPPVPRLTHVFLETDSDCQVRAPVRVERAQSWFLSLGTEVSVDLLICHGGTISEK